MTATIDLWANFLANEKLTAARVGPFLPRLMELAAKLAAIRPPKIKPHHARIDTRFLVVNTAIEMEFDLAKINYRGKLAMGRGLLDAWNIVYERRFGSTIGTAGAKESKRRDVKTRLQRKSQ